MTKAYAIEFSIQKGGTLQVWHTLFATPDGAHRVCYAHKWDFVRIVEYEFKSTKETA